MERDVALVDAILTRFHDHSGLAAKQALHHVTDVLGPTDWVTGPGDDAAIVRTDRGDLLVAGEALFPAFVAADPYGAGIGAVVANVNDVAAMGGRPLAIVDTIIGPDATARAVLAGLDHAARLYDVPVVGGHLTVRDDGEPSVSAFVVGEVTAPLLSRDATAGQLLLAAACLDGRLRADFPFYPSFEQRGTRVRGDIDLLPQLGERGWCTAAKDVSMAGLLGSLAMLLEPAGLGVEVDLDRVPRPQDVPLDTWLDVFPSFAFLLCVAPEHADDCIAAFADRGLACAPIGTLDATGSLRIRLGAAAAVLIDDTRRAATGLGAAGA